MHRENEVDTLFMEIINIVKKYHPSANVEVLNRAYDLAYEAHKNQKRQSGEPFIIHPLNVALILAELNLDKETLAAALLHDVVEDTEIELNQIEAMFGEEIAFLVDGVTKIGNVVKEQSEKDIEGSNIRKMVMATSQDIRVILIKFADRLHNLRTLKYKSPEKQKTIAKNTLEIYAPLAGKLGISKIKTELEDLSLFYLQEDVYNEIVIKIELMKKTYRNFIKDTMCCIEKLLSNVDDEICITYKFKHVFSIYKKEIIRKKTIDEMYDLYSIQVRTSSIDKCYKILGILHHNYKPIPGRIKDYIALPKKNKYQSIHTTLVSRQGIPFEVQIKTYEMDKFAEYGITASWKYSEDNIGKISEEKKKEKIKWLQDVMDWQTEINNNEDFIDTLKNELNQFNKKIFCFTPKGETIELPTNASIIDFAYAIHSDVGNYFAGAKVNGNTVGIGYLLKNGDCVEIINEWNGEGAQLFWLDFVRTERARNKIKQFLKRKKIHLWENIKKYDYVMFVNVRNIQGLLLEIVSIIDKYNKDIMEIHGEKKKMDFFGVKLIISATGDEIIKVLSDEMLKIGGVIDVEYKRLE